MVACAHGYAEAVEQGAHVEMMDVANEERHDSVLARGGAEETDAGDGLHLLHAVGGELALMSRNVVHAEGRHIVESGGKTVGSHIVGGACLKLKRQTLEDRALEAHALNHLATTLIGRQTVEPFFLAVEHTNTCGAIDLMSTESEEIAIEVLHIDLEMGCRLCSVHHHRHAVFMSNAHNVFHGVHRAEGVAHMRHANDLRAVRKQLLILVHEQVAAVVDGYDLKSDAALCCLQLPRHDVRMVLHDAHDHLVALAHKLFTERADHEVYALGGAAREDNLLGLGSVDETAHGLTRRLMQVGGLLREIMHATVHVGVDIKILVAHGIEHTERLLCCRRVVEIDERTVVDGARENRKIVSHLLYVVHLFSFLFQSLYRPPLIGLYKPT